jgi:hypothetical protein
MLPRPNLGATSDDDTRRSAARPMPQDNMAQSSRETKAEMASQDEGDTHLIHVSATLETPAYATVCVPCLEPEASPI